MNTTPNFFGTAGDSLVPNATNVYDMSEDKCETQCRVSTASGGPSGFLQIKFIFCNTPSHKFVFVPQDLPNNLPPSPVFFDHVSC